MALDVDVRFDLEDLERFVKDFEQLDERAITRILREGASAAGQRAVAVAWREYPPPQRRAGQRRGRTGRFLSQDSPIRTERQRRWWWATMTGKAKGTIPQHVLPGWHATFQFIDGRKTLVISGSYRRSGELERSIGFEVEVRGETGRPGASAYVGTDPSIAPYASWVIDLPPPEGIQARYHQGNWIPLATVLERGREEILSAGDEEIIRQIELAILDARAVGG